MYQRAPRDGTAFELRSFICARVLGHLGRTVSDRVVGDALPVGKEVQIVWVPAADMSYKEATADSRSTAPTGRFSHGSK